MNELIARALDVLNTRIARYGLTKSVNLVVEGIGTIRVDAAGAAAVDAPADWTLHASEKTFLGLLDGSINPMVAVMMGKLKLKGDTTAAMGLAKLLG